MLAVSSTSEGRRGNIAYGADVQMMGPDPEKTMATPMTLVLTLLAMPLVGQESKADPLAQLVGHAKKLGFAVEEIWTEREGRVRLVLRPGTASTPTASEDPVCPPSAAEEAAATADAHTFLVSVLETFSNYALHDKVKVDAPRVLWTGAETTTTIRVSFVQKVGYLYEDLMRVFESLQEAHPGVRLTSIYLGTRDPTPDEERWRPLSVVLATETQPQGPSALHRLATLRAALDGLKTEDFEAHLTSFKVDDSGVKWDMSIQADAVSEKLFAAIREAIPGDFKPGSVAFSPSSGHWLVSNSCIRFRRP